MYQISIKFAKGVLTIPRFEVCHWTEILIRNVVAFEQCHYPFQTYITDYIILLDFLIDTSLDVDTLVDKGIMVNTLGDSSAVANMVNNFTPWKIASFIAAISLLLLTLIQALVEVSSDTVSSNAKQDALAASAYQGGCICFQFVD
ncbi:hypothetical protein RIF29_38283 [Crotalaria pallida]|uniref:Uncharacterized protein n=1 Tax=Crotalaria pallida TaxID=3830 RepID=A0AAN9DZN2_CROPI